MTNNKHLSGAGDKVNAKTLEKPQVVRPQAPVPASGVDNVHAPSAVKTANSVAATNGNPITGDPVTKRNWSDPDDWEIEVT